MTIRDVYVNEYVSFMHPRVWAIVRIGMSVEEYFVRRFNHSHPGKKLSPRKLSKLQREMALNLFESDFGLMK